MFPIIFPYCAYKHTVFIHLCDNTVYFRNDTCGCKQVYILHGRTSQRIKMTNYPPKTCSFGSENE